MTLIAVWLRKNENLRELVIASDSRLSGGESWDACPKIALLPRPATAIAMSGDATEAYAFLLQGLNTCNLLDGHVSGRTDIGSLAAKIRKVYSDSRRHVSDLARGEKVTVPNLDVVLAGWSWRNLQFEAYSYSFNKNGELAMRKLSELDQAKAHGVYFAGDAAEKAKLAVKKLIKERNLPIPMRGSEDAAAIAKSSFLNWEPLEVLLSQIDDKDIRTVGGTPQVMKITQYNDTESFVWRTDSGKDYYGGRPILDDERFDRRILSRIDNSIQISYSDRSIAYGSQAQLPPSAA